MAIQNVPLPRSAIDGSRLTVICTNLCSAHSTTPMAAAITTASWRDPEMPPKPSAEAPFSSSTHYQAKVAKSRKVVGAPFRWSDKAHRRHDDSRRKKTPIASWRNAESSPGRLTKTRPPHHLGGVHERGAHYSSRRGPRRRTSVVLVIPRTVRPFIGEAPPLPSLFFNIHTLPRMGR